LKTCFSIPGLALVVLYILLLNDNIRNVDVFIVPFLITIAAFIFIVFTLISVVKKQFEAEKQLIEQLSEAKEKIIAQEKLLSLSTFAAGVAHDINNPVTHMYGNIPFLEEYIESLSQIANRQNLSNKEREQVTYITEDSKSILDDYKSGFARITEIIRDMKQLFKKKNNEHEEYDVSQLLQSTLEIFSRRGDGISSGVTIATAIESPLPLLCNRNDLLSVFQNLLSNAFDAVGEHGFIHIKARREENNIIINFYDNGTGISPDTLDSIFKPFYSTKEDADNIGVGLTMCKHIIESYFGEITIESEVNHYTDVMITLPVRKPSR
jgi:signal transduction histidine kinase